MFVLELTYTVPLERVDELVGDHLVWVKAQYDAGVFLTSGRKEPRDGGVIIAAGNDRAAIEELVASDPFTVAGVCGYRVTQFFASNVAPSLEQFREQPSAQEGEQAGERAGDGGDDAQQDERGEEAEA